MTPEQWNELEALRLTLMRIEEGFFLKGKPFFPRKKAMPSMSIGDWILYFIGFYKPEMYEVVFPFEWSGKDLYPEIKARLLGVAAELLKHSIGKRVYMSSHNKDYLQSLLEV